jgi:hypothetical protein
MSLRASCHKVAACRSCGGALSIPFCDLGSQPLANSYVRPEDAGEPDPTYPLNAVVCERCLMVQLDHVVDATQIFSDYAYFSSYSSSWLAHAANLARSAIARFGLGNRSFVVEVASNDGYLLKNFVAANIPCLGVEPAGNVAAAAVAAGVPTEVGFFGRAAADGIVKDRGHAHLTVAINVLAHVPDVNDFVAGLARLAGPKGVVMIEAPHVVALVEEVQFDTIYHEHYAYWSLHAMEQLLAAHGLQVFDVEVLPTHGTSLRAFAAHSAPAPSPALQWLRAAETERGVKTPAFYEGFQVRVRTVIEGFRDHLNAANAQGRRIAAYGAAAKGNTFLNACRVRYPEIAMVADRNPAKQGRLLPGSRIPIVPPERLFAWRPDEVVILPWNLAREISSELAAVAESGASLLVAVPRLQTLRAAA